MALIKCAVFLTIIAIIPLVSSTNSTNTTNNSASATIEQSLALIRKVYTQCEKDKDLAKCLKLQVLKLADKAIKSKSMEIISGVTLVRNKLPLTGRNGRLINLDLANLSLEDNQLSDVLLTAVNNFFGTRSLSVNLTQLVEEGRGKKGRRWAGPFMLLLAVKGMFMAMAYKGIAAMAGAALIIGKMALVLTAVLGLKKLFSGKHGSGKTTVEIVKHPIQSHSYTQSVEDGGDLGGHYHRSNLDELDKLVIDRIYKAEFGGEKYDF